MARKPLDVSSATKGGGCKWTYSGGAWNLVDTCVPPKSCHGHGTTRTQAEFKTDVTNQAAVTGDKLTVLTNPVDNDTYTMDCLP